MGTFENHQGSVYGLEVYQDRLYTCSGDNMARAYNLSVSQSQAKLAPPSSLIASLNTHFDFFLIQNRDCQAVFTGHTNKINCLLVSSTLNMLPCLFTGSSDETIRCYSIKVHYVIHKQKLFLLPTFMYGGRCRI